MTSKIGKARKNKFNKCKEIKISAQKLIKYKQKKQYKELANLIICPMKRQTCSSTKKGKKLKKENLGEPKKIRKTL